MFARRAVPAGEAATTMSTGCNIRDNDVLANDLQDCAAVTGPGFQLLRPLTSSRAAVLHGDHRMTRLRTGLNVHTSDTVTLQDIATTIEQPPGLTLMLFLDGGVDATIGGVPLNVGRHENEPVRGVMISRTRPDRFVRHARKGDRLRKVIVTMSPQWLAESGIDDIAGRETVRAFCDTHLARFDWVASPAMIAIAEQMLHPPHDGSFSESLYLESRALDLVAEAFAALAGEGREALRTELSPVEQRRLQAIKDVLADPEADGLSLDQLARQCGVSLSKMQRLFRLAHGGTVSEYVRSTRLVRARQLLEREGITVAEAAHLAGYSSPANFATAFKRAFGISPREARRSARA